MTSGRGEPLTVEVTGFRWLAPKTFELRFRRPSNFNFIAGQKIGVVHGEIYRDYSLIGALDDHELAICVRLVQGGVLSPVLSRARKGDQICITRAFGHFLYQSHTCPAVLVATGTGVAPFVAYARSGASNFLLLHGVHSPEECYYHQELVRSAQAHIACIPGFSDPETEAFFAGRVTQYLAKHLDAGPYDFYLCGRGEMIRDAMRIVDQRFPHARVFTEMFF